ncbi:ECF transporter S component [Pseudoclavibacter sp. CFCC 13796]|uniref:ECF transporter S component n=1 Tax=Pseudoclavibacter sp. CFCC 13796 TaxID=2615179 RepID=UPI001CE43587|nr:ECF transporter S component [Pseudoclavibacter sp. CFCC 13796]
MKRVSTTYLLICAAIGVAGALTLLPANWVSTLLFAAAPVAGMALAGVWLLPAVIALRLVRRPGAGVLTGLVSGPPLATGSPVSRPTSGGPSLPRSAFSSWPTDVGTPGSTISARLSSACSIRYSRPRSISCGPCR